MAAPEAARLRDVPRAALAAGLAAALPFPAAAAAMGFLDPAWTAYVFLNTLNYGLAALAFLGAVHAGLGLAAAREGRPRGRGWWAWSFAPGLLGLAALLGLVDYRAVLAVFLAAFALAHIADLRAVAAGDAPAWYGPLRRVTTALIVVAFGVLILQVNAAMRLAAQSS